MANGYGYRENVSHGAIIYEKGSPADRDKVQGPDTEGMIVGTSEWGWISDENGRRICAALNYFEGESTAYIEKLVREKHNESMVITGQSIGYRCGAVECRELDELVKKKSIRRVFDDKDFPSFGERPALIEMLHFVRHGDVIFVQSASHISTIREELRGVIANLLKKKVSVHILDQQFRISTQEQLDTYAPELE